LACSRSGAGGWQSRAAAFLSVRTVVRGDALVQSISAASILAKVARDAIMLNLDGDYPGYVSPFTRLSHAAHRQALELRSLGRPPAQFRPVRRLLANN